MKIRCAIYTRKSSEEGLEQGFNSLHAQREACAAYVMSQASEGWTLIPDEYDDGGISGGTLERPGLQRLLADIAEGRIDIVVVYKVDRLTRALLDFAKLVQVFDDANVSFVSVTQSFNTTTSMGRLTLNMLLSFAQFEREVTAERIRDKIAASKAKGMWMGGIPPLGYEPDGRSLAIIEEHAAIVRDIYRRYLELGTVNLVIEQLARGHVRSPSRTTGTGKAIGGRPFTRGQLYFMLKNPVYAGDIGHRDKIYPGNHPAIIDRENWNRVQVQIASHVQGKRTTRSPTSSLLAGLIVDGEGRALVAVHACKGTVRYRYYVSRALQHSGEAVGGVRIPAREIERPVADEIARLFDDPFALAARARIDLTPSQIAGVSARCADIAAALRGRVAASSPMPHLVRQIRVMAERIEIDLSVPAVSESLQVPVVDGASEIIRVFCNARFKRTGHSVRLVQQNGAAAADVELNAAIIRLLIKARQWWAALAEGELTVDMLAQRDGVTRSYLTRVVRLAFLAPALVEALLDGNQRVAVGAAELRATKAVPLEWIRQIAGYLPDTA